MKDKKQPWYTSITAIVLFMICFWPVGCVFLYLRWLKKYGKYNTITKTLIVLAICLVLFGCFGLSAYADSHESEDILLALFLFIIPGCICGFFGFKRNKKVKSYKKYLNYINARKKVKLDTLCNKFGVDIDTASNILTDMISKGMIDGYLTDDELIINGVGEITTAIIEDEPISKKEIKVVKCKECGAKNTVVVGERKECDYCGTILQ